LLCFQLSKRNKLSSGKWLIFLDAVTSLEELFRDIYIPFDCDFLVAENSSVMDEEDLEVTLTEVYHVQFSGPLQKYRIGNWSSGTGITWSTVPFYQRRGDLQGIEIRAAIVADVGVLSTTVIISHFL
jgi:hypothetical protein